MSKVTEKNRIEGLDLLRGLAVLGVVAVHAAQWAKPDSALLKAAASAGASGVMLFYVLSPLSLMIGGARQLAVDQFSYRGYMVRRFFRIAPMFYLAIAATLILLGTQPSYWAPDGIQPKDVALTAVFLHGISPRTVNAIPQGSWSIAVEFSFYLIFPLLALYCRRPAALFALFGVAVGGAMAFTAVAQALLSPYYPPSTRYLLDHWTSNYSLAVQMPTFIIGLLAYQCAFAKTLRPRTFLIFLGVVAVAGRAPAFKQYPLTAAAIAGMLVMAAVHWNHIASKARWLVHVGTVSYSVYLVHFFVIEFFRHFAPADLLPRNDVGTIALWALLAAVSIALSTATHRWIELPFIGIGKRIARRVELGRLRELPAAGV